MLGLVSFPSDNLLSDTIIVQEKSFMQSLGYCVIHSADYVKMKGKCHILRIIIINIVEQQSYHISCSIYEIRVLLNTCTYR